MRGIAEHEHNLDYDHDYDHDLLGEEPSRDLVLGAPALLGVFLAIALAGAICFGFGYSSGHGWRVPGGSPASASAPPSVTGARSPAHTPEPLGGTGMSEEASAETGTQAAIAPSPLAAAKPVPGVSLSSPQPVSSPRRRDATPVQQPMATEQAQGVQTSSSPVPSSPVLSSPGLSAKPVTALSPSLAATQRGTTQAGEVAGAGPMVQIAAVTRAADAQTLANALRHDGFAATVRTSAADHFFHVQIGPFATLPSAKAMLARLAGSGYNAFIKPQ